MSQDKLEFETFNLQEADTPFLPARALTSHGASYAFLRRKLEMETTQTQGFPL